MIARNLIAGTHPKHFYIDNVQIKEVGATSTCKVEYSLEYAADYFPYGKILREFQNGLGAEKYLTTKNERDKETGLDYRGARYYDADVARFLSLDPLASSFAEWSPYNYVLGNPLLLIDPDGRGPIGPPEEESVFGNDYTGVFQNATPEMRESNPVGAFFKDFSALGLNIMGIGIIDNSISTLRNPDASLGEKVIAAVNMLLAMPGKEGPKSSSTNTTSRAARREAMREAGIPTSQPLMQDMPSKAKTDGKVYVTRDRNSTVQEAKNDVSHPNQPHWEAGATKKNVSTPDGLNRSGNNNKPQIAKPKAKSFYDSDFLY